MMKTFMQKILRPKLRMAYTGLYSSSLLSWSILYFWGADWAGEVLHKSGDEIYFKGMAIIIGLTVVRSILIWHGSDAAVNWLNRKNK